MHLDNRYHIRNPIHERHYMRNSVFIAESLDGFIARRDGSIDWLTSEEFQDGTDYGYDEFIDGIDAIVMGRKTYETAAGFASWPYTKPVFVLSSSLTQGMTLAGDARAVSLPPPDLVNELHAMGYPNLYIDGGRTIQGFLSYGLIDELIITRVPILLGSGIPLFGFLEKEIKLVHAGTAVYDNGLVKSRYVRRHWRRYT
jgi:dihydrofolate reductase